MYKPTAEAPCFVAPGLEVWGAGMFSVATAAM